MRTVRQVLLAAVLFVGGCSVVGSETGAVCTEDDDCQSGLCAIGQCLDPAADLDQDGLTNAQERTIGTAPDDRDTDDDGTPDGEEVGDPSAPTDSDGDGIADCFESDDADADGDCLPDQWDAVDGGPAPEDQLVAQFCSGAGVCGTAAVQRTVVCDAGTPRCVITGQAYEDDESRCDGLDNDCDGQIDEGLEWEGIALGDVCAATGICGARGLVGIVECGSGIAQCSTAPGGSGSPAVDEVCNGLDDDCDGETDEDLSSDLGGLGDVCPGVGVCPAGVLECNNGGIVCSTLDGGSAYAGTAETCNGVDDDCDGLTDEDYQVAGLPVGDECGVGACAGGVVECAPSGFSARCSSEAASEAVEHCNGIDDDCDGLTDEAEDLAVDEAGCPTAGVCSVDGSVLAVCSDAEWSCEPGTDSPWQLTGETLCDGLDNDCDGETDEGFAYQSPSTGQPLSVGAACGVGQCDGGVVACNPGKDAAVCTTASLTTLEVCDGQDNDCDGETDEGQTLNALALGAACPGLGICGVGVVECDLASGKATCSTGPGGTVSEAEVETCNGLDDDCDGVTDEWEDVFAAAPTCAGLGICAVGGGTPTSCVDATLICDLSTVDGYQSPDEQSCNGLDDDCDGLVDEGLLVAPGTVATVWFDGRPTARTDAAVASSDGRIWVYGGAGDTNTVGGELWSLEVAESEWRRPIGTGPARTGATLTHIGNSTLVVIGGKDDDGGLVDGVSRLTVGGEVLTATSIAASGAFAPRTDHVAVYDSDADWVWVIGGATDGPGQATAALDLSDPGNPTWVAGLPEAPGWRAGPAAGRIPSSSSAPGGQIVVFGGQSAEQWDTTTWVLNVELGGWTPLDLTGPSPRRDASMAWHAGKLWMYGGFSAVDSLLADVWTFDPNNFTWSLVDTAAAPGGRTGHALVSVGETLALIGGTLDGEVAHSAWTYAGAEGPWAPVVLAPTPSARSGGGLFPVDDTSLWLVGGSEVDGTACADAWRVSQTTSGVTWSALASSPAVTNTAMAYRDDIGAVYIHGGVNTAGTVQGTLWRWTPENGAVELSQALPVASNHAIAWDPAVGRLLGHHAGLLWQWNPITDAFGALQTTGTGPGSTQGHRMVVDAGSNTLVFMDPTLSAVWQLELGSATWSQIANNLDLSPDGPVWTVDDHAVARTGDGFVTVSIPGGTVAPLAVEYGGLLRSEAAYAFHPSLGALLTVGGLGPAGAPQPGGARLDYTCP